MKKILIVGGNSGIGLESARQLTALGHHVVLLGRDPQKGEAAVAELRSHPGKSEFLAIDISTHEGVRSAAVRIVKDHERFNALLHTSGVLTFADVRTSDGLHPFFAVNFLSRYHLTQLLLPALRTSESARVVMVTSKVPQTTQFDFDRFPLYSPWKFREMTMRIQIGNHHYAAHLRDAEKTIRAGVVNAGVVRTGIWRDTPLYLRLATAILGPLVMDSVETAATNPVALCTRDDWASGSWWEKVGRPEHAKPLQLDPKQTQRMVSLCREITGA